MSPLPTAGIVLFALLAVPLSRQWLESHMAGHMLVQIPLLAVSGYWLAGAIPQAAVETLRPWNRFGITGALVAIVTALFWMLPRNLDATIDSGTFEVFKFASLPLLVGVPLRLSWRSLTAIGRGLIWSNFVAMLWVLAWLYLAAPVRVCNSYLLNEQALVGRLLAIIGFLLAAALAVRAFTGPAHRN
jgi:hypothetical protein